MKTITSLTMLMFNIQLFAGEVVTPEAGTYGVNPVNATTSADLSVQDKTFYDNALLQNARPQLYYNQFGKRIPLPKGHGKTVEVRRMETFKKITTPLVEGMTPDGNSIKMIAKTATVQQYGDYTPITDVLNWAAVDPILAETVNEHGAQAGLSLDTLTRDIVCGGTEVAFPEGIDAISEITNTSLITGEDVARVVSFLEAVNTPKINGSYVCILHPFVAKDLRLCDGWIEAHKYSATKEIFNGEMGELHGVRFVKTSEAKIEKNDSGVSVFNCLFFGLDAWARIDPEGMGLKTILKSADIAGGPLNQFSTAGWKAMHAALILYEERMINFMCGSSLGEYAKAN